MLDKPPVNFCKLDYLVNFCKLDYLFEKPALLKKKALDVWACLAVREEACHLWPPAAPLIPTATKPGCHNSDYSRRRTWHGPWRGWSGSPGRVTVQASRVLGLQTRELLAARSFRKLWRDLCSSSVAPIIVQHERSDAILISVP